MLVFHAMANLRDMLLGRIPRFPLPFGLAVAASLCAVVPSSAASAPIIPPPVAHLTGVERFFLRRPSPSFSGAAVRAFADAPDPSDGSERFDVLWFANPPGFPSPGIVLFEYVLERSSSIQNRLAPIPARSQGPIRSSVEIPADEIRRAGRVDSWRASLVWKGHVLARLHSHNWNLKAE